MGHQANNEEDKRSDQLEEGAENDQQWQIVQKKKSKSSTNHGGTKSGLQGNGSNLKKNPKTKLNLLERMSMSFYLTNFPYHISAKDIWNRVSNLGTVVDVFIPNRLSKAGKRFCFARFIRVDNAATLLEDLQTRGFGFVVFADPSVLDSVLQDRHTIDGRNVKS